jgi:protein O-mannosyl-transferase
MTQASLISKETPVKPDARWVFLGLVGLVVLALAGHMGVIFNDYITLDDGQYIYQNPMVVKGLTPETFVWAFTSTTASNWHPVTMLSHLLDVTVFGIDNPGAHHGVSLFFHCANACLVFWVLFGLTGCCTRSWVVAALFAVHPIHVESVAWASSRKDVLSLFFVLLTLWNYVIWIENGRKTTGFVRILLFYALALMSKPTAVTLPALMLLLDFWPLKRFSDFKGFIRLALEKVPLMALCAGMAVLTFLVQKSSNAMADISAVPMSARLANAPVSYARYLGKLFYPNDLAVLYPYQHWPTYVTAGCLGLLVFLTGLVVWAAISGVKGKYYYHVVAWFWFLGVLVPMIGVVQVGSQSMADRYAYISFIGLYVMVVWGAADFLDWAKVDVRARAVLCAGVLVALTMVTRVQVGYWAGPRPLYEHGVAVTKENFFLLNNLGEALLGEGRLAEARVALEESVRIHPGLVAGHENLGLVLMMLDEPGLAAREYQEALRLGSSRPATRLNLGWALLESGKPEEALGVFKDLEPSADSLTGVGAALAGMGKFEEARGVFDEVGRQWPGYSAVVYYRAKMLLDQGDAGGAMGLLAQLVRAEPGNAPAVVLLAKAMEKNGDVAGARALMEDARQKFPGNARVNRGGIAGDRDRK